MTSAVQANLRASLQTNPPFRAEHVGSLLRPRALKEAAKAYQAGTIAKADYQRVLEREVARVVQLQEAIGLPSITDGEFGRSSWFGFFFERLQGFTLKPSLFQFHDEDGHKHSWMTCYSNAKIQRDNNICVDEFERLQGLTRFTPKANMPAPSALHFFRSDACRDPLIYPDLDEWWDDVVAVYQAEIRQLAEHGCRYLQLDEVPLAMLCDSEIRAQIQAQGLDPEQLTNRYIAIVNEIVSACPSDMTIAMHLCRGNFRSRWMAQGGYETIAEKLFNELDIDAFFLEYDSPRAGDFTPLRFMPINKRVVLGLISSKTAVLESPDAIQQRVDEASQYISLEQLALSPQCGFASVAGGNLLSEDEQRRKLELVVKLAEQIWGSAV